MISELTCKKCQAFMRIFLILGLHPISNEFPSQSFREVFPTEAQRARSFFWGSRAHSLRRFGRRAALRVAIHPSSRMNLAIFTSGGDFTTETQRARRFF